ncbi:MAG TPA: glycosyltransferase family 2 protein [Thermoplasmata archaeon]|nr:glycosyltransferase family 2 protein [Thermoplasmata archaeon]
MGKTIAAIPAFNEEKTIGSLVLATRAYVDEVAVIDDGSTDRTAWIAERAGAHVVRHVSNRGYGAAIRSCFDYARYNGTTTLVILDGDGQHRPEEIPAVVEPVLKGEADVSIGSRFLDAHAVGKIPRYRRFGIRMLTRLTNLGSRRNRHVKDGQSGFRAYSRKALDLLDPREADMGASAEILWDADRRGLKVVEVPINVEYDEDSNSQGPVRHALGVVGSMVRYVETEHPIAAFGLPGIALIVAGIALGIDTANRYWASPTQELAEGDALLTVLLILIGVLLSFTGLILHAVLNAGRRRR